MGEGARIAAGLQSLAPRQATLHARCVPAVGHWAK